VTSTGADYEATARHLAHNGELAALRARRREQGKHALSDTAAALGISRKA
jgi:hypothetical protein